MYFRLTKPIVKKRKLLQFNGIKFPCFPSVDQVTATLAQNIVENLEHNPITQPKEYDAEAANILNSDKIYIGMDIFWVGNPIICI